MNVGFTRGFRKDSLMYINFCENSQNNGGIFVFYDRYVGLCTEKGVSPSRAAEEIGINKASVTNWKKNGYTPRAEVLRRIAEYFRVSVGCLVEGEPSGLTERDRRDIARDLDRIMATLESAEDLQFDGDPMSDGARESIRAAVKLGLEAARVKNKERFTPQKYRKE